MENFQKMVNSEILDFLRNLIKDKAYIHLAYMTGILPIKKYGTHSALNMFDEFSMLDPGPLAAYVGFTEEEIQKLCERYQMDMTQKTVVYLSRITRWERNMSMQSLCQTGVQYQRR